MNCTPETGSDTFVMMSIRLLDSNGGKETRPHATIDHINWLQVLYFVLGLLIFGLVANLWMTEARRHHAFAGNV